MDNNVFEKLSLLFMFLFYISYFKYHMSLNFFVHLFKQKQLILRMFKEEINVGIGLSPLEQI